MPNALVTGTSTGIGEACALRLAEHGWTVFAGVRRAEDGDRLKAEVTGDVRPVILDVSDRDHTRRVIEDLERVRAITFARVERSLEVRAMRVLGRLDPIRAARVASYAPRDVRSALFRRHHTHVARVLPRHSIEP